MRKVTIQACVLAASVVVCGRGAAAQDAFFFQRQIDDASPGADVTFLKVAPAPQDFGLMAVEPFEASRPVVDAPYTAEAVTEVTQALVPPDYKMEDLTPAGTPGRRVAAPPGR